MGPVQSEQVFRSAVRRVLMSATRVRPVLEQGAPLETMGWEGDPPMLIDARNEEDATFRAHPVGEPETGFAAFLDGAQRSWVVAWDGAVPIVGGRVAAAVRRRVDRRLASWREPRLHWRIYADFGRTPSEPWLTAFARDDLVDAGGNGGGDPEVAHPLHLLERARTAVNSDRERLERALAIAWCDASADPLLVDGGIAGEDRIAESPIAIGLVKSHRTMYVTRRDVETVLALKEGERSSAFVISPRGHSSVLSWYLRLRPLEGRGALWGLVRVEVSLTADVPARADQVSRWLLAERLPLALPDPRWDTLLYGVRGTEDFLRAVG